MSFVEIGTAKAVPGSIGKGYLKIGELGDGSPVNVPIIILNGVNEGPCLWLQAMIHGDEIHGSFAISRVVSMLVPKKMSGKLIAVPALNILALRSYGRAAIDPSGYFHNVDLNLSFPGHTRGDFNEQAANILFDQIKKHANFLIDLHSAGKVAWSLCYNDGSEYAEEALKIAKYFGVEIIVSSDYKGTEREGYSPSHILRMPFALATSIGIPSIIVEAGWGIEIKEEVVKLVSEGIINVMKYVNIIPGEVKLKKHYTIIKRMVDVKAKQGGIFIPKKNYGAVSEGEILGAITNLFGEKTAEVISPTDGIILSQHCYPFVSTGKLLFHLGVEN